MRIAFLALPFTLSVAAAGGFLMAYAKRQPTPGIDLSQPPHVITRQMEIETAAMANHRAPDLTGISDQNKPIKLAPDNAPRPQFVLFIKDECPCSVNAQPIFNDLSRKYKGSVDFYGVIDGDVAKAKNYAGQFSVAFPVIGDKDLKIIHAYEAKAGVYSALIARNGHIVKMWPGYCVDILKEMNDLLSQTAGIKTTPFDPEYAPTKRAAGCAFEADWK
ncbi:MAG TPA: hypothetical protein VG944_24240 [Fimbriimonas sp.]|nr:hypothetical protein [Fimbriimonas sp.]